MRIQQYNLVLDEKEKATLVRESGRNYSGVEHLDSPGNVARLMRDVFKLHERAEEYVYLVCTNAKCKPTGFFEVSHGTCGYALISPREILIRALLCGAVCILLVHNHPGGDPFPSREDDALTMRMKEAAQLINMNLCDHIIIGGESYYSYKEQGNIWNV